MEDQTKKYVVVKRFNDRITKVFHKIGEVIEVNEQRYQEIKDYVDPYEETVKKSERRKDKELDNN